MFTLFLLCVWCGFHSTAFSSSIIGINCFVFFLFCFKTLLRPGRSIPVVHFSLFFFDIFQLFFFLLVCSLSSFVCGRNFSFFFTGVRVCVCVRENDSCLFLFYFRIRTKNGKNKVSVWRWKNRKNVYVSLKCVFFIKEGFFNFLYFFLCWVRCFLVLPSASAKQVLSDF